MLTTPEHETWKEDPVCIPLEEIRDQGIGKFYEVQSDRLEPIAIFLGEGRFRGITLEARQQGNVYAVHLAGETHTAALAENGLRGTLPYKLIESEALPTAADDELLLVLLRLTQQHYADILSGKKQNFTYLVEKDVRKRHDLYAQTLERLQHGSLQIKPTGHLDISSIFPK